MANVQGRGREEVKLSSMQGRRVEIANVQGRGG